MTKVRIEAVVEVPDDEARALIDQTLHPVRQAAGRALSAAGTLLSLEAVDHDALRRAEQEAAADAERHIVDNADARARLALVDAHASLDGLNPCPPRQIARGGTLTVSGRIDWFREHVELAALAAASGRASDGLCDAPGCLPCGKARSPVAGGGGGVNRRSDDASSRRSSDMPSHPQ